MMSTHDARMLTRYNAWANQTLFDAVAALPDGEATKPRQTLFKTMVNTLNHLQVTDIIWQAYLEGRKHDLKALNTVLHEKLADLWNAQQVLDRWFIDWSDRVSDAELAEVVSFTLLSGNKGEMSRSDIVFHVVNHTSYHRGFVADLFFQVPRTPPLTDLPIFLREVGRPA
ncbi:MAG: damage-inducible protein DinB [Gammaproteobacteria bacterium]|nr:damage-inducible protein DinB [Gammaproteobacteria bacterium]